MDIIRRPHRSVQRLSKTFQDISSHVTYQKLKGVLSSTEGCDDRVMVYFTN